MSEFDPTVYKILNEIEMYGFKTVSKQKILPEEERKRQNYISLKKAIEIKNKHVAKTNKIDNFIFY